MEQRMSLYLMRVVGSLIIFCSMLGCQRMEKTIMFETHSTLKGAYRGLEIGATKQSTLEKIRKLEVRAIKPIPTEMFNITKANIEELKQISAVDGIRLTNYSGLAIDLFFKQNQVTLIRRSVPVKDNTWFQEGETQADVVKKLTELLMSNGDLSVFPMVYYEGDGWVDLSKSTPDALNILNKYGAWTFEVTQDKPAGANFEVLFSGDSLLRIDYRRTRIPLD
jgi:hypothetical protein